MITDHELFDLEHMVEQALHSGDISELTLLGRMNASVRFLVWGTIPMPPNAQVTDAQAKKLAAWVLGIK